jgi:hypothetical protein
MDDWGDTWGDDTLEGDFPCPTCTPERFKSPLKPGEGWRYCKDHNPPICGAGALTEEPCYKPGVMIGRGGWSYCEDHVPNRDHGLGCTCTLCCGCASCEEMLKAERR